MDKYSRSTIYKEGEFTFVAPQPPREKQESKKLDNTSSRGSDKREKSKSSSFSSSKHHSSSSSKYSSDRQSSLSSSSKSNSGHKEKDMKKSRDNKSSENKHHKSHSSSSHKSSSSKRSREEVDSKGNEPKSKKIKSDHEKSSFSKSSSSKSSSSKLSSSKSKEKTSSSSSSRSSKSQQNLIPTPELLTQKPKLELSPDIVDDLNCSISNLNYQQLPVNMPKPTAAQVQKNNAKAESDLLTQSITSIKSRTKIFSGNSRANQIPTLKVMCFKMLTYNLDSIECVGDVPFEVLRPVLEKANAEQLAKIEFYNPHLLENSDILWKTLCQRKYRSQQPVEMESWREMYERCKNEEEGRLKRVKESIFQKKLMSSSCVQKTKIAFVDHVVKAPRSMARKPEQFSSTRNPEQYQRAKKPEQLQTTRKPVMSFAARVENLKSLKPELFAPGNSLSKVATNQNTNRENPQRTNSSKPAPMMAKLLSKFRR